LSSEPSAVVPGGCCAALRCPSVPRSAGFRPDSTAGIGQLPVLTTLGTLFGVFGVSTLETENADRSARSGLRDERIFIAGFHLSGCVECGVNSGPLQAASRSYREIVRTEEHQRDRESKETYLSRAERFVHFAVCVCALRRLERGHVCVRTGQLGVCVRFGAQHRRW
jgi:hypothetical protein